MRSGGCAHSPFVLQKRGTRLGHARPTLRALPFAQAGGHWRDSAPRSRPPAPRLCSLRHPPPRVCARASPSTQVAPPQPPPLPCAPSPLHPSQAGIHEGHPPTSACASTSAWPYHLHLHKAHASVAGGANRRGLKRWVVVTARPCVRAMGAEARGGRRSPPRSTVKGGGEGDGDDDGAPLHAQWVRVHTEAAQSGRRGCCPLVST